MSGLSRWCRRWWPGLVPLIVLIGFAGWSTSGPLETYLAAQASASLRQSILDKTQIAVAGRDVTLAAEAFSNGGRRAAVNRVAQSSGVRLVNDQTRLVPEAKPFVWTIERDVVRVTLGGAAPLPMVRSRLMDDARRAAAGAEVVDRMGLARGAPPRFDAAAALLAEQIGRLRDGKITLTDSRISIVGMARDLGGREAIMTALAALPEGFSVAESNALKAPPYVLQAYKDPVAATVTLNGYVPDEASHAAIVGAAERKFFREKVTDNLKTSIGAPGGFAATTIRALGALSRLSTGTLAVSDRDVALSGDALYGNAAEQIRNGLARDLGQGWAVKTELSIRPAASPVDASVCQQLFAGLLGKAAIRFQSGRTTIDQDSVGLLDNLVETALRCPAVDIEIAGHTDAAGDDAANQTLSEERARTVTNYLVEAGLQAERLRAVGYGSAQPVAANDTEPGRAQNRRIEFVVKEAS